MKLVNGQKLDTTGIDRFDWSGGLTKHQRALLDPDAGPPTLVARPGRVNLVRLEALTFTGADGEVFDVPLFGDATLTGDLPGEGVDTVRWSEPMSASLTVTHGPWRVHWIELPQKGQHAPRMASTQCRRARRTVDTKRHRLFNRRAR